MSNLTKVSRPFRCGKRLVGLLFECTCWAPVLGARWGAKPEHCRRRGRPLCADCRRGQSLVVHAINEGRQAARQMDLDLAGKSLLAGPGGIIPFSYELVTGGS